MAFEQRSLDDYIDVATRVADFRAKYPDGSLQPVLHDGANYRLIQAQGFEKNGDVINQTFVVVVAAAFRTPTDPRPGIGMAWEIFPGRTPYTRGSELQNAETSAWGRAIIAVGASDSKRGIASREEVRNRQAERDDDSKCSCGHGKHRDMDCTLCGCKLRWNADGSLSRSRTSDAEKAGAGVMTDAEQRAHNQLAKPPPNSGKVVRMGAIRTSAEGLVPCDDPDCNATLHTHHRAPAVDAVVDDRWTTDAPSWAVGVDPPEDQPGSILPAQRSQIMAVYTALGIKDRDKRIADVNTVLSAWAGSLPGVESVNDLSHQQAARLLENLHERHTGKTTRR